ncbi:phosphoadenosine phosphosulfate reductase domain-containing protein [Caballeronia telluris]|uniref:Gp57 n=1 Tax=Caballeronia telluris TaxID=326475 RepID=A0A158G482_9BURK|nr:phosphoadenosine phosphosulfate reductase family protein [Caballeronia telluris]SAL26230.1 gp57 [Caballeronia telluris]
MSTEHNVVSVSGGKDSTALLLLAIERGTENLQAVFADTGHEHPETVAYVQYLNDTVFPIRTIRADFTDRIAAKAVFIADEWREQGVAEEKVLRALAVMKPTGNPFLDLCIWKGRFPSTKARFCSEELKRNPIIEQVQRPLLDAGDDVVSWQGVRRDESENRRNLPERECKEVRADTGAELWNYRPILDWTVDDVFAMHRKHGIKPNPLYQQGMGRVGCMPCIHARKDELLEIALRFPEEIERVSEWERIVGDAGKRDVVGQTFFTARGESNETAYSVGSIWQRIEWSKTSRGGRQYDIFRTEGEQEGIALCTSIYGLCE